MPHQEAKSHKKRKIADAGTSSSSSTSSSNGEKRKKSRHKKLKRRHCNSSADSASDSESYTKKKHSKYKKKKMKHKKSDTKHKSKKKLKEKGELFQEPTVGPVISHTSIAEATAQESRAKGPMTKEMWEKQQSVVRRVFDVDTGRARLVKGSGEIVEEIVSKARQKQINKLATQGDGISYSMQTGTLK